MNAEIALPIISGLFLATAAALTVASIRFVRLKRRVPLSMKITLFAKGDAAESGRIGITELQNVFDSITDTICIIDRHFRIYRANKSYCEVVGKARAEAIGGACHQLFWNREKPCDECPARVTLAGGGPVLRKKMVLRGCDKQKHLEVSVYPIFDEKKHVTHVIEYVRDMTEEAAMLEQLIRSEKLAGIGIMTTGIAHEMNNALSGIAGTASNLLTMPEKFGLNEKAVNRVFSILDAAARATGVMKNLLQFSNPLQEETHVMINLGQLIKKTVTTVFLQESPDIERRLTIEDSLPPIRADFSKIELVLVNIVSNAIRSLQEKKNGSLRENAPFKGSLVVSARRHQDSVLITVTDNGVGIPENIRTKVFDPFFSTWPQGKGTGLGLSTALRIVDEHGGRIFFESLDDLTTFSIQLPIDRRMTGAPPAPPE